MRALSVLSAAPPATPEFERVIPAFGGVEPPYVDRRSAAMGAAATRVSGEAVVVELAVAHVRLPVAMVVAVVGAAAAPPCASETPAAGKVPPRAQNEHVLHLQKRQWLPALLALQNAPHVS